MCTFDFFFVCSRSEENFIANERNVFFLDCAQISRGSGVLRSAFFGGLWQNVCTYFEKKCENNKKNVHRITKKVCTIFYCVFLKSVHKCRKSCTSDVCPGLCRDLCRDLCTVSNPSGMCAHICAARGFKVFSKSCAQLFFCGWSFVVHTFRKFCAHIFFEIVHTFSRICAQLFLSVCGVHT